MNFLRIFSKTEQANKANPTRRIPDGILFLLTELTIVMGVVVFLSNILAAKIWVCQLPDAIHIPKTAQSIMICGLSVRNPLYVLCEWIGPTIPFLGWTLTFDAGLLLFPVSFLVGDMIVEIYGKKVANFTLWVTAIVNVVAFLTIYLATFLPSYDAAQNVDFSAVFGASATIVVGSSVSFLLSRILNNNLFVKYRERQQGIFKWRALRSSFWGRLADTIVFNFIAFRGRLGDWELIRHMACAFAIGMFIEWLLCEFVTSHIVKRICKRYNYTNGQITH